MPSVIEEADNAKKKVLLERIKEALTATGNNRTQAAKELGMSKRSFYRRLQELGLTDWDPMNDK